jgi:hypothetical protein
MRLTDRLYRCFENTDSDEAQDYLNALRSAWQDVSSGLARNAWIILLLMAAYELAARNAVSSVIVGPFTLAKLEYVRLFVPAIVSYLLYEQVLLVTRWIEMEAVHRYLMHFLAPTIENYDLDAFLVPRLPALSNLVHSYSSHSATPSKNIRAALQYALGALVLVAILYFDASALKELYGEFGAKSYLYWINVAITGGLVIVVVLPSPRSPKSASQQ